MISQIVMILVLSMFFLRFYHLGWHEWLEFRHYQDTLIFFVKALVNIVNSRTDIAGLQELATIDFQTGMLL